VALLVNNLGGTPTMELALVARRAVAVLESSGLVLERVYLGTFLSALEMTGVSLSVLRLDDPRLAQLDAPTSAPAWPNAAATPRRAGSPISQRTETLPRPASSSAPETPLGQAMAAAIREAAEALRQAAPRLTELDQTVGDGDLGINLERGAQALLEALPIYPLDDPAATLQALGLTLQRTLGGTSGALYSAFFLHASSQLRHAADPLAADAWAVAFREGCLALAELGGTALGDRTMLDALVPAADAFQAALQSGQSAAESLRAAADAAAVGAQSTAALSPRRGRSSYLGNRAIGCPDPGAEAVAIWLRAIAR
jgi:dihydroxyacetone kinase